MLTNLIKLVADVAPTLATVLGSPVAGIAISLISSAFGLTSKKPEDIINAIQTTPNSQITLKQLEIEHSEELLKLATANYSTEVDDRKNARAREIALHDHVPAILAFLFVVCYAAVQLYCLIDPNTINDIISARLQDILIMVVSYYFGSSHKSAEK